MYIHVSQDDDAVSTFSTCTSLHSFSLPLSISLRRLTLLPLLFFPKKKRLSRTMSRISSVESMDVLVRQRQYTLQTLLETSHRLEEQGDDQQSDEDEEDSTNCPPQQQQNSTTRPGGFQQQSQHQHHHHHHHQQQQQQHHNHQHHHHHHQHQTTATKDPRASVSSRSSDADTAATAASSGDGNNESFHAPEYTGMGFDEAHEDVELTWGNRIATKVLYFCAAHIFSWLFVWF